MDPQNPIVPLPDSQIDTNPSPVQPLETPVEPKKPKLGTYYFLLFITLIAIGILTGLYFLLSVKTPKIPSNNPDGKVLTALPRYFINCQDVRQVVEEENLLYAACLGGIIVVDKTSGEVKDQIGMPDGLGSATATSLVKKGGTLFIGTQDGITVFDLNSRKARKISVAEGLVNGSNIQIFEDGDALWVATFDGVSRIDTKTFAITNFKSELDSSSEKHNIVNVLITDSFVYFLEVGSVHSNGAVIMFNKNDKTFKTFKPESFGEVGKYARIDFNSIGKFGDQIFISESNKMFASVEGSDTWQRLEAPHSFVKTETGSESVVLNVLPNSDSKGIILAGNNKIYRYVPGSQATEVVYDFKTDYPGILHRNSGGSVWLKGPGNNAWISSLNLSSGKLASFDLARPANFGSLIALIDGKPVVNTERGIFSYDLKESKFIKYEGLGSGNQDYDFSAAGFIPIPGTGDIFTMWQTCGQGCVKPTAQNLNYNTGEVTQIPIPEEILKVIAFEVMGGVTYDSLNFAWRDIDNGEIGFFNSYGVDNPPESIIYNFNTKVWRVDDSVPETATLLNSPGYSCNNVYTFASNGGKFSNSPCDATAQLGNLTWKFEEGKIKQINTENGETSYLSPPLLPAKYTPFDTIANPQFSSLTVAQGHLWITSDRGLISYNPTDSTYKLYGPSEGILSQDILKALVGEDSIWVLSNWGGLSVFKP